MYMLCQCPIRTARFSLFFFFNDTATTEIYTLSLHDALPIFEAVLENTAECPEDGSYCRPNYSVVHYYQQLDSALLEPDRKSTRLNSSHGSISYAVFCLKKKKK